MPVARKRLRNDEESVDMVADIVTKHAAANKVAAEQVPALIRTVRSALTELTDGLVASERKMSREKPAASSGESEAITYRQLVEGMEAGCQFGSDAMPSEEDCAKVRQVAEKLSKEHFPHANIVGAKVRGARATLTAIRYIIFASYTTRRSTAFLSTGVSNSKANWISN